MMETPPLNLLSSVDITSLNDLLYVCADAHRHLLKSGNCWRGLWYRGQSGAATDQSSSGRIALRSEDNTELVTWSLLPSAHRYGDASMLLERRACALAMRLMGMKGSCSSSYGWGQIMCEMQHHGFPTRLLDWSRDIHTALWFAVNERDIPGDAVVWALNPVALNHMTMTRDIIDLNHHEVRPLLAPAFTGEPVGIDTQPPLAVDEPSGSSARKVAQLGAFTVHVGRRGAPAPLEWWGQYQCLRAFRVPEQCRSSVRDALEREDQGAPSLLLTGADRDEALDGIAARIKARVFGE